MKLNASNPLFSAIAKHARRPLTAGLVAAGITLAVMMPTKVEGATLVSFTFPSTNSLTATSVAGNLTVSNFALSTGTIETNITTGTYFPNEPYIEETGGWTADNQGSAKYFTFTITASEGYTFDLTNLSFNAYATSAGPSAFGFGVGSTNLFSVNAPNASLVNVDQSIASYTGLTTAEIRIHGWLNGSRTSTGTGVFRLDDVLLQGSVNAILSNSLYWLGSDTTRGGSGTWADTGGTAWSTTDANGSGTAWDSSKTATFNTAAANVTIDGTVNANNGLTFAAGSNGSTITGGTAINLGGATASINAISTATSVTATIGTNLTGTNGMTKSGAGTLVLTGDKTYTGGTTISGGTLQLGDGTTNGSVLGAITNNSSLAVNNGSAQTLSNDISGTGSFTKTGAGNLTLSGTNTYNGGTTVSAGTLTGTTTSLQGAISNNAAVAFDQATSGTYAGNMTGSGSLTKLGGGNLTLTGTNGYSGGTTVSAGTLTGTTASLQGPITNNAAVVFDQASNGTYAGNMTGTGSFTKTGAGNLTLSGTNGYSGGTTVSAGTLTGTTSSLQGNITNNSALVFNQATSGTYAGTLDGTGSLAITGPASVTLSGNNSHSGGTSVTAGTLVAANNTALGSGAVEVSGASLLANAGITVGNAITVESVTGSSQVVAYWNFNSYNGGVGPIAATSGSGSISLAGWTGTTNNFSGSSINAISPDASGNSLSLVSNSGNGSYIQISGLDFAGLINAQVSYATQRTTTGFNDNQWSYSTDGSSFTDFGAAINPGTGFALASVSTSALNNAATGFLRYTLDGATNSSQNNRIDNLQITASSLILPTLGGSHTSGTAEFSGGITLDSSVQLTSAAGGTVVFSGAIANGANGAQGIIKLGAGTVELTGANTYTGATQVNAGTLLVNNVSGSATGSGSVTVASGATLGGSGTIGGAVTVNGIIAPGNSIGTLDTGSVTWNGAASASAATDWQFELGAGETSDLLAIDGDFTKGTGSAFNFDFGGWDEIGIYTLITWTGETNFLASNFSYSNLGGGHVGTFSIDSGSLLFAIPEPSTALAGLLLGLGLLRRRRA